MINKIELPYRLNDLEPFYSQETLNLHYNVLYTGYIEKTNNVLRNLDIARINNDFSNIKCLEKELSYQGSGVILHELFFKNMISPGHNGNIDFNLEKQIIKDFGSIESFKKQFTEAASSVEASGWCLLVWVKRFNKLEVLQCEKHQNLTLWGCIPILVLDMWEHSYYLQYKTSRPDYITAFWNIINWQEVSNRFLDICFKR